MFFQTEEEYLNAMHEDIDLELVKDKTPKLYDYWMLQETEITKLSEEFEEQKLWVAIQQSLLLDAKLVLLRTFLKDFDHHDFNEDELIDLIERDHKYMHKEMCGYQLNQKAHHSLIFGKQTVENGSLSL